MAFRPLLPRPVDQVGPHTAPHVPPPRKLAYGACASCRRRKVRCNAHRPVCSSCKSHGFECVYGSGPAESRADAFKRSQDRLEEQTKQPSASNETCRRLVASLKHLDEASALSLLHRLRDGASIASLIDRVATVAPTPDANTFMSVGKRKRQHDDDIDGALLYEDLFNVLIKATEEEGLELLRRIKSGAGVSATLRQAKDANLLLQLSLVPETRRRYQFPHRPKFPQSLTTDDNPYIASLIYECSLPVTGPTEAQQTPYLTPYHAAEIVDPWLWNINAARWTSVTKDDRFVSKLLNSYFLHQYPIFLGFHKDYFLEDMAKGRDRFCSSLLVNTLLCAASHTCQGIPDRAKFWKPHNPAYQFLAEAKRLWETQIGQSSLTSIHAAIVLNTISDSDSLDKVGRMYMLQAVAMAHEMKLFDSSIEIKSVKMQRARAFTAWCLYVWDCMEAFYYFREPLIHGPPDTPLPDVAIDPTWYGEMWVRYPLNNAPTPTSFGQVVRATMELRHLTGKISRAFFSSASSEEASQGQILGFRSQLETWFKGLPEPLTSRKIHLPSHLRIHLEYYTTLIILLRVQGDVSSKLAAKYGLSDEPAADVISRAYKYIETLFRLYYHCHDCEAYDAFIKLWCITLGNHTIGMLEEDMAPHDREVLRSTLLLCVKGLYDQGRNNYVEHITYLALRDRMNPEDKDLLMTDLPDEETKDQESIKQYNQSRWPIPIIKINEDPTAVTLVNLVKYESLSLSTSSTSALTPRPGEGDR
ncbi:hypothetical protein OQA88_1679 [Cercophora sp. LCS_1]